MLLIDGAKYQEWLPEGEKAEEEFEQLFKEHSQEVFGENSVYLDIKRKLKSEAGSGSIPDGYLITFGATPQLQVVEVELASHTLGHIVSQVVNIVNGIGNVATQQKICNEIEDEINQNEVLLDRITKSIKPKSISRFLSDFLSTQLPIVNVVINKELPKLGEALNKIAHPHIIVVFQTFAREGVGLTVHAHLFKPLYTPIEPTIKPTYVDILVKTPGYIKTHYFEIPKESRSFFPGYNVPFILETGNKDEIKTAVVGANKGTTPTGDRTKGHFIKKNLGNWVSAHPELSVGDKLRLTVIEPMKKYRLEIVK